MIYDPVVYDESYRGPSAPSASKGNPMAFKITPGAISTNVSGPNLSDRIAEYSLLGALSLGSTALTVAQPEAGMALSVGTALAKNAISRSYDNIRHFSNSQAPSHVEEDFATEATIPIQVDSVDNWDAIVSKHFNW